jgi:hypothetical protein
MPSRVVNVLRQIPLLPLFAIVLSLGIVAYAVFSASDDASAPTPTPVRQTNEPTLSPIGPSVIFTTPQDNAYVPNPGAVSMAIGGGLRFQAEGEPQEPNGGHLWVTIDEEPPAPGSTMEPGPNRINLSGGEHQTQLPPLSTGPHLIRAIWVNTQNVVSDPLVSAQIVINIPTPTPAPSG